MNKTWDDKAVKYLKDNAAKMRDEDIAAELSKVSGRVFTKKAVKLKRQRLGIEKECGRGVCKVKS